MAYLVQILLPVYSNEGEPFPHAERQRVRRELTERFGGLTAYTRAPAEGIWEDADGHTQRDDVIVFEVMADELDRGWWIGYARELAARFEQDALVIRAMSFESLSVRTDLIP